MSALGRVLRIALPAVLVAGLGVAFRLASKEREAPRAGEVAALVEESISGEGPRSDPPDPPPGAPVAPETTRGVEPPPSLPRPTSPRLTEAAFRAHFADFAGATSFVWVGDQLSAQGVPMRIASFETKREPPEVLKFYATDFTRRGWPWQGLKQSLRAVPYPAISATEPNTQLQASVICIEHPEGDGTTVILGLADMDAFWVNAQAADGKANDTGDLPLYPGAVPYAIRSIDREVSSVTVSFDTADSQQAVETFYRERLAKDGLRELGAEQGMGGTRSLRFGGAAREWTVAVSSAGSKTMVTAYGTFRTGGAQ